MDLEESPIWDSLLKKIVIINYLVLRLFRMFPIWSFVRPKCLITMFSSTSSSNMARAIFSRSSCAALVAYFSCFFSTLLCIFFYNFTHNLNTLLLFLKIACSLGCYWKFLFIPLVFLIYCINSAISVPSFTFVLT